MSRTKGDTAFPPTLTCLAAGAPVDLTGATVSLKMVFGDTVKTPAVTASNQTTHRGELMPDFDDDDVDTSGQWAFEVLAVFPSGKRATFRGPYLAIID